MIRRSFLLLVLTLLVTTAHGQFFTYCKDTTRIPDEFQPCGRDFTPVCGCDNITYRNECSAYFWGGLYGNSWTNGTVCTGFYIDLYPTAITYFPAVLNLFMKQPGPATLYVFDIYGRLKYQRNFYATFNGQIFNEELHAENYDIGIYSLIVIAAGEKQVIKFAKATDQLD